MTLKDKEGKTPKDYALSDGFIEIMKLLSEVEHRGPAQQR